MQIRFNNNDTYPETIRKFILDTLGLTSYAVLLQFLEEHCFTNPETNYVIWFGQLVCSSMWDIQMQPYSCRSKAPLVMSACSNLPHGKGIPVRLSMTY